MALARRYHRQNRPLVLIGRRSWADTPLANDADQPGTGLGQQLTNFLAFPHPVFEMLNNTQAADDPPPEFVAVLMPGLLSLAGGVRPVLRQYASAVVQCDCKG